MRKFLKQKLILVLLTVPLYCTGQRLIVSDFKIAQTDISAREQSVYDANKDGCAIIKIRTGLENIVFAGNLEIRRNEFHDGEYWLWVSPGTNKLSIEAPDYEKIEYDFPVTAESFNVYIILLSATLPEKTVIRSVYSKTFLSRPAKANVYINNVFYGKTPLNVNLSIGDFQYKIEKNKFTSQSFVYNTESSIDTFSVVLKKDPVSRRFFSIISVCYYEYGGLIGGLNLGTIGKTGWYFSFSSSNLFRITENNTIGILTSDGTFFPTKTGIQSITPYKLHIRGLRIIAGVTQQINKFLFLNGGIGYANTKLYYSYFEDGKEGIIGYSLISGNYTDRFIIDAGIIFRIKNRFLVSINDNLNFKVQAMKFSYKVSEWHFGLGYNF